MNNKRTTFRGDQSCYRSAINFETYVHSVSTIKKLLLELSIILRMSTKVVVFCYIVAADRLQWSKREY